MILKITWICEESLRFSKQYKTEEIIDSKSLEDNNWIAEKHVNDLRAINYILGGIATFIEASKIKVTVKEKIISLFKDESIGSNIVNEMSLSGKCPVNLNKFFKLNIDKKNVHSCMNDDSLECDTCFNKFLNSEYSKDY